MINDPHYLGSFESLSDVWSKYPSGGTPMDYISLKGEIIYWDNEKRVWGKEFTPDDSEPEMEVKGDLSVTGDVNVGGVIKIGTLVIDKDFASLSREECEAIVKNYAPEKGYVNSELNRINASIKDIDLSKISRTECEALIKDLSYQKSEVDIKINEVKDNVEELDNLKLDRTACLDIIKEYTYTKEEIDNINPEGQMDGYTKVESDARYFTGINIKNTDYTFNE